MKCLEVVCGLCMCTSTNNGPCDIVNEEDKCYLPEVQARRLRENP